MIIDTTITNAAEIELALNVGIIQWQSEQTANDPNLTIITQHWFNVDDLAT